MPGKTIKSVAVIGAGASGLTTIKNLLEEGHQVTCFEKAPDLGGIYRYSLDSIGVYESTLLTSSSCLTAFSDFPAAPKPPLHFKHHEFQQYLRDYAAQFNLLSHIRFGHTVLKARQQPNGAWSITVRDEKNNREETLLFDAVAVCAGVHQYAVMPDVPGKELFKGQISHGGYYKNAAPFAGKDVVVIGGGESASDIVDEISKVTRHCILSLRRGVLVIPRLFFGKPNDFYTNRLFYTIPAWLFRIRHKEFHCPSLILFLSALLLGAGIYNIFVASINLVSSLSPLIDWPIYIASILLFFYLLVKIFQFLFYLGLDEISVIGRLSMMSNAGHGEQFATKCQGIAKAIASNRCTLKPGIKRFTVDGVEFDDNTASKADAVIFCTGYVTRFPFLNIDSLDCRTLYKSCFDPALGKSLCFIGFARPAIGAIPPIAELQARWFSQILSGASILPDQNAMIDQINADAAHHKQMFAVVSDRVNGLVDFTSYMDELAGYIGCRPQWQELKKHPLLLLRLYFNPFLSCQYRLQGPHSKRELAISTMKRVPLDFFQCTYSCFFVLLTVISHVLYRLGFKNFKPNLPL